jgi:hypothetical protein
MLKVFVFKFEIKLSLHCVAFFQIKQSIKYSMLETSHSSPSPSNAGHYTCKRVKTTSVGPQNKMFHFNDLRVSLHGEYFGVKGIHVHFFSIAFLKKFNKMIKDIVNAIYMFSKFILCYKSDTCTSKC